MAIGLLLTPFLPILFFYRFINKKEKIGNIFNRFGIFRGNTNKKTYWIHCASVGESISIIPFILKILQEDSEVSIIITSITVTSANIIKKKILECNISKRVKHVYFPYDHILISTIFLLILNPKYIIFVDSEIWPITLRIARIFTKNIYLVNARISPRSFKRWTKLRHVFSRILLNFKTIYTSSNDDYNRYKTFSNNVERFVNIKYYNHSFIPSSDLNKTLNNIKLIAGSKNIITIGSSHEGEEDLLFEEIKNRDNAFVILAPRHPNRIDRVIAAAKKYNINYELRSKFNEKSEGINCIIIDSIGDLRGFYGISDVAIVCGSFVQNIGGHNPIEAISRSVPVIMGRYHDNCTDIVNDLKKTGCLIVSDIEDINKNIDQLLELDKDGIQTHVNMYQNIIEELYDKIFQKNII